jgi:hypothetical protein
MRETVAVEAALNAANIDEADWGHVLTAMCGRRIAAVHQIPAVDLPGVLAALRSVPAQRLRETS